MESEGIVNRVVPRVGAWIETLGLKSSMPNASSYPVWVRGLKRVNIILHRHTTFVVPRVGAWIETIKKMMIAMKSGVVPRVGAWIETG